MTGTDDIIILSDEDDDIKIEPIISPKRSQLVHNPHPIFKSGPPSTSSSSSLLLATPPPSAAKPRAAILVLTEPKSISYGIERGYKLKQIHGVKRLKPDDNNLFYLVEYELCDDYEFVPSNILHRYCNENFLIEYLEKLTQFID